MEKLEIVKKACEDKLGENINIIKVDDKTTIADYFVVVTGNSILQTQAIANEIEFKLEKEGFTILGQEGFRDGAWILMDLGDIIVHIFTRDSREFYSLEKLWD
ncbi:ribosome silencing factor [Peptoniphilaceae bacterium SGI.131]